jgi:hypothetical protein
MESKPVGDVLESNADDLDLNTWAEDPLAQFFATAWRNTVHAFTNDVHQYRVIAQVDGIYRQLVSDEQINGSKRLEATFLVRSHASLLAAASLALSGQVAEAYVLMRAALEAALQGLFLADSPERQQHWIRRNDDEPSKQRAQEMFSGPAPLECLRTTDPATAGVYEQLVARALDRQAHPNAYAIPRKPSPDASTGVDFIRQYFVLGDDVQRSCLRSIAQVGMCCLTIFYYAFADRYRDLGLDVSVKKLRRGH